MKRREFLKHVALAGAGAALYGPGVRARGQVLPGSPKRVLIMGAGLAGLSAGYELTQAGYDVTILEARTRAGGRVFTLREPFSDGLYAEAGATLIPASHDYTLKYIKQFGLELDPFWPSNLSTVDYMNGRRFVIGATEPEWPVELTPAEKKLGNRGMHREYVHAALQEIGNPADPDWSVEKYRQFDQMSWAEFLRSRGASPAAISLFNLGFLWGDGINTVSALTVLRDSYHLQNGYPAYKVRGGNDLLPRAFAVKLAEKIRYGTPVTTIEHNASGVKLTFLQAGAQQSISSDYLVCAIPFSVLRRIKVSPAFSSGKQRAIQELPYFSAARVYLQCRKNFWIGQGLDGFAATDLPINEIWDMTSNSPGPRGILESYMAGPQARRVTQMAPSERVAFVLDQMEKVYPGTRENFEGGTSKCWDEDEWARGASSWYRPGQMTELWPHVARPEGRVHFAGDHTSAWIRWQQGALQSGNRVAAEIQKAPS